MKISNLPLPIYNAAIAFGLLNPKIKFKSIKITEGVSSDIWHVKTEIGLEFCIKRALKKLTVKEDWFAPVSRSNFEASYFKACQNVNSKSFPKILGHDKKNYILAMEWFRPEKYILWKKKLLDISFDKKEANLISNILNKKHSYFYDNSKFKTEFENDKTFYDIRIEPYIIFTSNSYPEHKNYFVDAAKSLVSNKKTVIHGDFSPKNILIGPDFPVILDAETACWGDPIFDLAFCNNHIILKSILNSSNKKKYMLLSKEFIETYISKINWEDKNSFIDRFLKLVPLLILARLDGKSPIEYYQDKHVKKARTLGLKVLDDKIKNINSFFSIWENYV